MEVLRREDLFPTAAGEVLFLHELSEIFSARKLFPPRTFPNLSARKLFPPRSFQIFLRKDLFSPENFVKEKLPTLQTFTNFYKLFVDYFGKICSRRSSPELFKKDLFQMDNFIRDKLFQTFQERLVRGKKVSLHKVSQDIYFVRVQVPILTNSIPHESFCRRICSWRKVSPTKNYSWRQKWKLFLRIYFLETSLRKLLLQRFRS